MVQGCVCQYDIRMRFHSVFRPKKGATRLASGVADTRSYLVPGIGTVASMRLYDLRGFTHPPKEATPWYQSGRGTSENSICPATSASQTRSLSSSCWVKRSTLARRSAQLGMGLRSE